MGQVSLVRHQGNIGDTLSRALGPLGGLAAFVRPNDRVMLKPNLNGADSYTSAGLTESLVRMLLDLRAKPFIAEATFGDAGMTRMFFQKTGYADLAARYGISLCNLNEPEPIVLPVDRPIITDRLELAPQLREADRIINLPCMKVHYATGISLCMKNLKGLLVGGQKRRFHEIGLDEAIVDLNNTVHPHLNIADALTAMERMGPRGGDLVDMNLVLAGRDAAEVDYVGMQVMGYTLEEVGHLRRYLEFNSIDPGRIEVLGEKVEDVRHPLRKVNAQAIVPSEFTVYNHDACSSCMNAFLLACSMLEAPPPRHFEVCMGSQRAETEPSAEVVAFGKCCPMRPGDVVIKGCPPYPFALKEQMRALEDGPKPR
jgi:uncharacterized protein (DUF362 family)